MPNLSELQSTVFMRLAEASGATFTDAEVTRELNNEYKYIQTKLNEKNDEYLAKAVITSTTTNETYAFPVDLIKLLQIELKINNNWTEVVNIPYYRRNQYVSSYTPYTSNVYYYILGSNYGIIPVRSVAGSNDLRLSYLYKPADLANPADTPVIPPLYHELLVLGAVNKLRRAVKEPPIELDLYHDQLNNLLETVSPKIKGRPKQIRMVPGLY